MKILFVDDESRKLKRLNSIISDIAGINQSDIDQVLDLQEAKIKMKNICYDLVILDLKISEHLKDACEDEDSEIAGLDFIDEIIQTDSIKTPNEIIILTEYDCLQTKCCEIGKDLEYQVLKYDELSKEWEDIIKNKVKYHIHYENSVKLFSRQLHCDVAIVCAVNVEMNGLERVFNKSTWSRRNFECDSNDYYEFEINNETKKISVVIVKQQEMGMSAAATITQNLNFHYSPKYIIMVGIAAGIGDEKDFGDIIVATEVWNYSNGKYITTDSGDIAFSPDPRYISLSPSIESILKRNYEEVLYKIRKEWNEDIKNDLHLVYGPLACGSAVVSSLEIVTDMITNHSRKTAGLDMESYGVFYGATYGLYNQAIPLCLKSISDFADEHKGNKYQKYASYTSSSFVKYLIEDVLEFG